MSKRRSDARQRLVETAERLFYAEGIHTVGIDRIIAEAGVAKMTLYNHFASKDDLVLAVLEFREDRVDEMFSRAIARFVKKGHDRLAAFFAALRTWFESGDFRGCAFINARAEFADARHPAAQFAAGHKRRFHAMIREILMEAGGENAAALAPAVALLVEGAIVAAVMEQSPEAADVAHAAAMRLLGQTSV